MKKKPTPMQARALKALNTKYERAWKNPSLYFYFKYHTDEIQNVQNNYMNGQKVRVPTAKILLKNGWIEKSDNDYWVISDKGKAILENLSREDFISKPTKKSIWTTADILDALTEKYQKLSEQGMGDAPKWIYFDELRSGSMGKSIIDFWAMACWHSLSYRRISYEIKISRADFLKEIKDPTKREFGMKISNYFYFISPPDLIKAEEIPKGCGLIELSEKGKLVTIVRAPIRFPHFQFTWDFASCLGRKIFKAYRHNKTKN